MNEMMRKQPENVKVSQKKEDKELKEVSGEVPAKKKEVPEAKTSLVDG